MRPNASPVWRGALAVNWSEIIIDESQKLAHSKRRSGEMKRLYAYAFDRLRRTPFVLLLSGTLFKSSSADVASALWMMSGQTSKGTLASLKEELDRSSDVVSAEEVGGMPEETHVLVNTPYADKEYSKMAHNMALEISALKAKLACMSGASRHNPRVMVQLSLVKLQLYTAVVQARLFASTRTIKSEDKIPRDFGALPKCIHLLNYLADLPPGAKVVIACSWIKCLRALRSLLSPLGYGPMIYDGRMRMKERRETLDSFRDDPKCRVLLLSKSAGGCGLNLRAKHMIIFDPAENDSKDKQCGGRVVRRGHEGPVKILHYINSNGDFRCTESDMWESNKRRLASAAIFGDSSDARRLQSVYGLDEETAREMVKEARSSTFDPSRAFMNGKSEVEFEEALTAAKSAPRKKGKKEAKKRKRKLTKEEERAKRKEARKKAVRAAIERARRKRGEFSTITGTDFMNKFALSQIN